MLYKWSTNDLTQMIQWSNSKGFMMWLKWSYDVAQMRQNMMRLKWYKLINATQMIERSYTNDFILLDRRHLELLLQWGSFCRKCSWSPRPKPPRSRSKAASSETSGCRRWTTGLMKKNASSSFKVKHYKCYKNVGKKIWVLVALFAMKHN